MAESAGESKLKESMEFMEDCKVLNYVDRADFLEKKHISRCEDSEDLNTYIFENSDGTRTLYMFDENVKYKNSDGIFEKDISIKKNENGYTMV